jgi:hypothetical protein
MRSKTFTLTIALFASVVFSTAVSAQKVDSFSPPGVSFGQYKTYFWVRADKAQYPERAVDEAFIQSIDSELSKRGLKRVETPEADLIASYQIAIIQDMEWSAGHSTIPWLGGASGTVGLVGGPVGGTNEIQKGVFIFDVWDAKEKRQVWQTRATKTLDDTTNPDKRRRNIQKAMAKVFKTFPK